MSSLDQQLANWLREHPDGWGPAWYLAAVLTQRHGERAGLQATPLYREYVGWYGVLVSIPGPDRPHTIGRVTASGDVERWDVDDHPPGERTELDWRAGSFSDLVTEAEQVLGLPALPERSNRRCAEFAIAIGVLAHLGLQLPTGSFSVDSRSWGPGLPNVITVHHRGTLQMATHPGAIGADFDPVTAHREGASLEALADEALELLSHEQPIPKPARIFDLAEHRHRYAAWCAARGATRGLRGGSNAVVRRALEDSDLPALLQGPAESWPDSGPLYRKEHERWCLQIMGSLHAQDVHATFGRAAKIVALYVKTLIICGGRADTALARVAFPPIDRVLLRSLARTGLGTAEDRRLWRSTNWTQMNPDDFDYIIVSLYRAGFDTKDFWRVEEWWRGDDGGASSL